jgi:hypothetical protein
MNQTIYFQRLEGLAIFGVSLYLYVTNDFNLLAFILLLIAIDATMAGYMANKKTGAVVYNIGHSLLVPIALFIAYLLFGGGLFLGLALIWLAHIGMDRALGFGFKLSKGFEHTHLGKIGKSKK